MYPTNRHTYILYISIRISHTQAYIGIHLSYKQAYIGILYISIRISHTQTYIGIHLSYKQAYISIHMHINRYTYLYRVRRQQGSIPAWLLWSSNCGKTVPTNMRLHSPPRTRVLLQNFLFFPSSACNCILSKQLRILSPSHIFPLSCLDPKQLCILSPSGVFPLSCFDPQLRHCFPNEASNGTNKFVRPSSEQEPKCARTPLLKCHDTILIAECVCLFIF